MGPEPQKGFEKVLKVSKKPLNTKDKGWRSRKEGMPGLETWKRGMGLRHGFGMGLRHWLEDGLGFRQEPKKVARSLRRWPGA